MEKKLGNLLSGISELEDSVEVQKKTFTNWANEKLKKQEGVRLTDLETDLENGVILIKLLEMLAPGKSMPGRYYAQPAITIQKLQNLMIAFRFITDVEKIPLVNIGPSDILENKKLTLGIIWALILRYHIGSAPSTTQAGEKDQMQNLERLKKLLLLWLNAVLPGQCITNFTTDWNNGINLSALVDFCKPSLIPHYTTLDPSNGLDNLKNAMSLAEKYLSIPQVMLPEDLAARKPDELSVITYLTYFCGLDSPGQLSLLLWIQRQIPSQKVSNFTTDWISGRALGALVNVFADGKFPSYKQMSTEPSWENCQKSIGAAEQLLGVKQMINPEEFANPDLDQLVRVGYLAQFRHINIKNILLPATADKVEVSYLQVPGEMGAGGFVWLELDCSHAGYGVVTAEARGSLSGNIHVDIKETSHAKYRVAFQPKKVDIYTLAVLYGDSHVKGSPFTINFHPSDPEQVCHVRTFIPEEANQAIALVFDISKAGKGELIAEACGELGGVIPINIEPNPDGNFMVSFKPPQPDMYKVDVRWGTFSTHAAGASVGPVPIKVEEQLACDYTVSFKPPHPDSYEVNINWGGKPVPGSPFTINLLPPAKPDKVECSDPIYTIPGEIAELLVDISNAGSGMLTAQCSGKVCRDVSVNISDMKIAYRTYQVSFTPLTEDIYTLSVFFEGTHVKGSPFTIDMSPGTVPLSGVIKIEGKQVPDATKCMIIAPENIPTSALVGELLTFKLDASIAGPGNLEVSADDPSDGERPSKLEVRHFHGKWDIYEVNYTPTAPGLNKLHLKWANEAIPSSPISLQVIKPKIFEEGKAVAMDIDADCKPNDIGSHAIHEKTRTRHKVKTTKVEKGKFKLSFQPKELGIYSIYVQIKQKDISGSPFRIKYGPLSKPEKCVAYGLSDTADIGKPATFTIDAREAGSGELNIMAFGPSSGEKSELSIIDNDDGTFLATYIPKTPGDHHFDITWGGETIPCSPLYVSVGEPLLNTDDNDDLFNIIQDLIKKGDKPDEIAIPEIQEESAFAYTLPEMHAPKQGEMTITVGTPLKLTVKPQSERQRTGELIAVATGEKTGKTDTNISQKPDGTFEVCFNPHTPDCYTLNVKLDDKHIPKSPFIVNYIPAPVPVVVEAVPAQEVESIPQDSFEEEGKLFTLEAEAESTEVQQEKQELTNYVGRSTKIRVRPQAWQQNGEVVAIATGIRTGPNEVTVTKLPDDTFEVDFNPSEPDRYTLDVKLNNEPIPRSPIIIDYIMPPSYPNKCKIIGLEDLPRVLMINKEVRLIVDTQQAGTGELEVKADGPSPIELKVAQREGQKETYDVTCVPPSSGHYSLNFIWDGRSIPCSPVKLVVIDMATIATAAYGRLATVDIEVDSKPADLRAYALYEGSMTQLRVKINQGQKGKYRLTFQPKEPGLYCIYTFVREIEISGSPIVIRYAKPPKPEACKVIGFTTTVFDGEMLTFTVDATEAGGGELHIRALGPGGKEKGTLSVGERKDDTYRVEYIPTAPGKHQFQISWAGKAIPGSPYPLTVRDHTKEKLISSLFLVDRLGSMFPADVSEEGQKVEVHTTTDNSLLLKVKAQTPEQKKGILTVSAIGNEVGLTGTKVTKRSADTFEALFTPPKPDRYTLKASLSGEVVPLTPITVFYSIAPPDPSKCRILGLENVPPLLQVKKAVSFQVDTRLAGEGKLKVTVSGPLAKEAPKLIVKANAKEPLVFDISYLPTAAGLHKLTLTWSGEPIPGSPLSFDISPVQTYPYGKPMSIEISAEYRTGELESYAIHQEHGTRHKVKVNKVQKGGLRFAVQPKEPGLYGIHVLVHREEIPGSPFFVRYDLPPKPEAVIVRGLRGAGYISEPVSFVVDVTSAGSGDLNVKVKGPKKGEESRITIKDNRNGTYSTEYTPNTPGDHQFDITWSGRPIPGSPFHFTVTEPAAVAAEEYALNLSLQELLPEEFTVTLGRPVSFTIPTIETGAKITATASGDKFGTVSVNLSQNMDGTYVVQFCPEQPDRYTINVKLNNEHVTRSPFIVNYVRAPPDPTKCKLYGKEKIPDLVMAKQRVKLIVDTRQAGYGSLDVRADAPMIDHQPPVLAATPRKEDPRLVEITYTPTAAGIHTLHFLWADKEIPGSPISFSVVDPNQVILTPPHKIEFNAPVYYQVNTTFAGSSTLTATCSGSKSGNVPVQIKKQKESEYTIAFTPLKPDTYNLSIKWAGREILNSPFLLKLLPVTPAEKVVVTEPVLPEPGRKANVLIDTSIAGKGALTAYCIGEKCGRVPTELIGMGEDKHKITFTPQAPELYKLHVFYDDTQVKGSPFEFDLRKPKVMESTEVSGFSQLQEEPGYVPAGLGASIDVQTFTLEAGQRKGVREVKKKPPERPTNSRGNL